MLFMPPINQTGNFHHEGSIGPGWPVSQGAGAETAFALRDCFRFSIRDRLVVHRPVGQRGRCRVGKQQRGQSGKHMPRRGSSSSSGSMTIY